MKSLHHTLWGKTESFPLRWGIRQGCSVSPLLFNIVLEVLARAIRWEKRNKWHTHLQRRIKMILFTGDIILYVKQKQKQKQKT